MDLLFRVDERLHQVTQDVDQLCVGLSSEADRVQQQEDDGGRRVVP